MALLSSGDVGPTRECFLPSKLGTDLFFVVLSRPALAAAGQRLADDGTPDLLITYQIHVFKPKKNK